jgi:hypothetical protein
MRCIGRDQLHAPFEQVPDGFPVDAGGFHGDMRATVLLEPIAQAQESGRRRFELFEHVQIRLPCMSRAHATATCLCTSTPAHRWYSISMT